MGKSIQRKNSVIITRSQTNTTMLEEVKEINKEIGGDQQFFSTYGDGEMHSKFGGKVKRGGVGGKSSKSMNFKQQKNANKRRDAKA